MSIKKQTLKTGYRYIVRYRDPNGVQRKRAFTALRQAQAFEDSELTKVRTGEWIDHNNANMPFADWAAEWLTIDPAKRDSTYNRDEIVIRLHLNPTIGKRPLGRITPLDVQRMVNKWTTQSAPHTVHRQYRTLAAILRSAVIADVIVKSPCRGIKLPKISRKQAHILDAKELHDLIDALGPHGPMAHIGAVLGLRWGEVAGLRIRDVDILKRQLRVEQQIARNRWGAPTICGPKTEASTRTIAITESLAHHLAAHMAAKGVTLAEPDALLFTDADGHPLRYSNWRRRAWVTAREAVGLPTLGFHDLRRANATAMVVSGVDIKTAQARLGHADPRMTLAIYAQATTSGNTDAAARLAGVFDLSQPEKREATG